MIIFAMPSVALASSLLISDRLVGTQFYNRCEHGDPLLWQHLFWFFGHPEVYIIFLPAAGLVSVIVGPSPPPGVRLPVVVLALVVDRDPRLRPVGPPHVRHRAAARRQQLLHRRQHGGRDPDRDAGLLLDRDDVGRRPRFQVPMLFVDRLHRHLRDRRADRRDGRRGAARPPGARHLLHRRPLPLRADRRRGVPAVRRDLLLVPEGHRPDDVASARQDRLLADVRRLQARLLPDAHHRPAGDAAAGLHLSRRASGWSSRTCSRRIGAFVFAAAVLLFVVNGLCRCCRGAIGRPNPWDASSLEWAAASPPPPYNFAHIPVVESRTPLWDQQGELPVVTACASTTRRCC